MATTRDKKLIYSLFKGLSSKALRIKKAAGQTNRNYIVAFKGNKFFVRLPWENDIFNRTVEGKNILRLLQNSKLKTILPKYYLYILKGENILDPEDKEVFDVPDGTMVIDYIEGKEFRLNLLQQEKMRKALIKTFRIFHSSSVRLINDYDVFRDEIEKYRIEATRFPITKIINSNVIEKIKQIEKIARIKFPLSKKGISTHNDFLFQNFIVGKRKIYMLDFEYAGFNRRGGFYYDFSFLFADNLFRKPQMKKEVFEMFLQTADKVYKHKLNRKRIYYGALAAILVMVWWGLLRYFNVKTKKEKNYFKDYVQKRSGGLLDLYNNLR
ncbi:MAG: hypothetical protein AAB662_03565 [Patescibacteria group bacterium]